MMSGARSFCCSFLLACSFGESLSSRSVPAEAPSAAADLPPWIADSPAFQQPTVTDAIRTGNGKIRAGGAGQSGWLVHCNEREGHGVELQIERLCLSPPAEDFLMVAPWPLADSFSRVKLYSGKFTNVTLLIPNTKSFRVLFSSSVNFSELVLTYRRYGNHIEDSPSPTDNPNKKKETVFEVQLKGKSPSEYLDKNFLEELKKAVRGIARRYCSLRDLPFNDSMPTDEMVRVNRISFCPFEWPERERCASLEHSVFVSGVRLTDGFIADYQLTADHLKAMWAGEGFPELEALGITVFRLPQTAPTVLYWSLIIAAIAAFSLISSFLFCRRSPVVSSRKAPLESRKEKKIRRPKLQLGRDEKIPSFMFAEDKRADTSTDVKEDIPLKNRAEEILRPGSEQQPIKNYFGSFLFGSNRAFEEDEDTCAERRPKLQ